MSRRRDPDYCENAREAFDVGGICAEFFGDDLR